MTDFPTQTSGGGGEGFEAWVEEYAKGTLRKIRTKRLFIFSYITLPYAYLLLFFQSRSLAVHRFHAHVYSHIRNTCARGWARLVGWCGRCSTCRVRVSYLPHSRPKATGIGVVLEYSNIPVTRFYHFSSVRFLVLRSKKRFTPHTFSLL